MKTLIKLIAMTVVLTLSVAALASCGGSSENNTSNDTADDTGKETEADNANIAGEVKTSGNITVFVPEEFDFTGTNLFNEADDNVARLINKEDGSEYFLISLYDKSNAESSIDMTRDINEAEDVTVEIGGKTWAGVKYNSYGYDVFQVYCEANSALVTCCGYTLDSDTAISVLSSIK